ncbi:transposable element Tcb1 transposase [Trichonephila clavipes]|nr:transposable element Tcb1 transposase [Trichonephila clavipes]
MPLRRFRRQYEQLLQFERRRIIGMMKVGWSARRVAHLLGRYDCVGTSGSETCHLHEHQAQDALGRPVFEKTSTSNIISPNQYGFTNKLSTLHPLIKLTKSISEGFQKRKSTSVVFVDVQKAFDHVRLT